MLRNDIRNVAIIAHVDHGKTTMVDQMLRQSGLFRSEELDKLQGGQHGLIVDSNDQERERGITILAKNIAIRLGDVKVNLMDTPGHADFGGEVERTLQMADGVFLLVDAAEGPLPQTRFVLRKAFARGLKPVVVINKIDRPDARIADVHNMVFDLFLELGASDADLEFPLIYSSGKHGIATLDMNEPGKNLKPLLDAILTKIPPPPDADIDGPLQMQVLNIEYSDFVGRIAVGKIYRGKVKKGQRVKLIKMKDGRMVDDTIVQVLEFERLGKREVEELSAGDIVALVGLDDADIGDTVADFDKPEALPEIHIDEPTMDMVFRINDSPFAGQDGKPLTSRELKDRLDRELQRNVALRVRPTERGDEFIVSGRGVLHLSVLIETMRREGSELSVGKPRVIIKEINGQKMEPVEYLVVDVPASHVGPVMALVLERQGQCTKMEGGTELTHLEFTIPARSLIGMKTRMMTATSGMAIMTHNFHEYQPVKPSLEGRANGVMISLETAKATAYAIEGLQERGVLFVSHMEPVYEGQVVAEHCRDNDLTVNVTREKKLTNMRASGSEIKTVIKPPRTFELEAALEYIEDDELVEVTPTSVRIRKVHLKEADRKKADRSRG